MKILKTAKWSDQLPGGLADEKGPGDFCPKQLAKGLEIELEHTDDPRLALEIAMDHLEESEDFRGSCKNNKGGKYYDRLEEMENKIEANSYFDIKLSNYDSWSSDPGALPHYNSTQMEEDLMGESDDTGTDDLTPFEKGYQDAEDIFLSGQTPQEIDWNGFNESNPEGRYWAEYYDGYEKFFNESSRGLHDRKKEANSYFNINKFAFGGRQDWVTNGEWEFSVVRNKDTGYDWATDGEVLPEEAIEELNQSFPLEIAPDKEINIDFTFASKGYYIPATMYQNNGDPGDSQEGDEERTLVDAKVSERIDHPDGRSAYQVNKFIFSQPVLEKIFDANIEDINKVDIDVNGSSHSNEDEEYDYRRDEGLL